MDFIENSRTEIKTLKDNILKIKTKLVESQRIEAECRELLLNLRNLREDINGTGAN